MSASKSSFANLRPSRQQFICIADRDKIPVEDEGEVTLKCKTTNNEICEVTLKNVLFVPLLASNLASISCMTKTGAQIHFYDTHCKIKSAQNEIVMSAEQISNGVYRIKISGDAKMNKAPNPKKNVVLAATAISRASLQTWHCRLVYLNYKAVCNLPQHAEGIQITDSTKKFCQACVEGKYIKRPFPQSKSRAKALLELIPTDLCVVNVPSYGNYKSVIKVYHDHSRMPFISTESEFPSGKDNRKLCYLCSKSERQDSQSCKE